MRLVKEELCSICNESRSGGINILDSYVCRRCEEEMIKDDLNQLKMEFYKSRVKSLWKNNFS